MDLSAVQAALSGKSYSAIAPLCDDLLLQAVSRGTTTDEWPYAVHLLAHLYLNDLNSARFFWKSLPQEVKDTRPELVAVWRVGQCLWNRDYSGVYMSAQGFEWGLELSEFITAFLESYRKRIFQLLTSAYSTIIVSDVRRRQASRRGAPSLRLAAEAQSGVRGRHDSESPPCNARRSRRRSRAPRLRPRRRRGCSASPRRRRSQRWRRAWPRRGRRRR